MDGHALLGDIGLYSCVIGDGGPRSYRRRGSPLPDKYMPGRFLADMRPELRAFVVRAVNDAATPAPWFLRCVVDEEEPRAIRPLPPVDRRWSRRGRWSTPRPEDYWVSGYPYLDHGAVGRSILGTRSFLVGQRTLASIKMSARRLLYPLR